MRAIVAGCIVLSLSRPAVAQDDVIARARAAAEAGRRVDGIAMLASHLERAPNDVDARLVYGLILSWDGKYDEARAALQQVIARAPDYVEARVALMNVEWWSGRHDDARIHLRAVQARDPNNAQARLVQQRLDARTRPWSAGLWVTADTFSDERKAWLETSLTLGRETPVGTAILRGSNAERFGLSDQQIDVEFYPVFRAGTYALVGFSIGADDEVYPEWRAAMDIYQAVGRGWEVAGGFRRLQFPEPATMYLFALTKYLGNWMITGKTSVTRDDEIGDAWTYHATARWYFGPAGRSFVGGGYIRGFSREEPRGAGDLVGVDADTFRGQAEIDARERFRLQVHGSRTREERAGLENLWQNTLGAAFIVRF